MSAANDPSNAGDAKTGGENLSAEEFIAHRIGLEMPKEQAEEEQPAEETEAELPEFTDSQEAEVEGADDSDQSGDEVEPEAEDRNEVDLLNLSADQIRELAKKGKSRLLERIGELTAKNKALEEKFAAETQGRVKEIPQEQNPFAKIDSFDALKAKYEELEKTLELTDSILEEHEDYGPDDIILVGDAEFTKKDIRKANRNARDGITKYLPAQNIHLARAQQQAELAAQYKEMAKQEIPEIEDTESDIGKNYQSWVSDQLVDKVKQQVPEIGFQIEYILAHAARSIFGGAGKKVPTSTGTKLKVEPPASPVGAGAARSSVNPKGKQQEAYKRFEASGSVDDWVAARIARMSKS
jgi:hypothetical protein